jgi:hypothetical protein
MYSQLVFLDPNPDPKHLGSGEDYLIGNSKTSELRNRRNSASAINASFARESTIVFTILFNHQPRYYGP